MRLVFGIVAALALTGAAHAQDVCLTYETDDGGAPVIQTFVQGQGPFALVLDTAASGTTLDEATATRLGLIRDTATETAEGLTGPMDVHLFHVPTLTAGPLALRDFTAAAIPAPTLSNHTVVGLAGVDLFGQALTIWNATHGCVTIKPSGDRPGGDDWSTISVKWIRPWKIMLPIRIGTIDGWGLLDTGAQHTVLNPVFAQRLGLTPTSGRLTDGGEISGIDATPVSLAMTDVDDIRVGQWHWARRSLRIGDLPVFTRLGDTAQPLAVIGIDWLGDQTFAIDYGAETVWQRTPSNPVSVDKTNR